MASEGNGTPLTRLTQRLPVRVLPEPRIQSNSSPALDGPNRQIRIVLLGKTGVGMDVFVY